MKHSIGKVLLLVSSILFTLIALEIALRLFQPGPPRRVEPQVRHVYVPSDPSVGRVSDYWYLAPNQDAYHLDVRVQVNALGLRNREVSSDKSPETYRILTLGDSHTFGFGVADEQTWPRLLENRLRRSGARQAVEVINAGVEALAVEQEVQLLEDRLLTLKPDLVILTYYWNDMPMIGAPNEPWTEDTEMIPSTMVLQQAAPPTATLRSQARESLVERVRRLLKSSYLLYTVVQRAPVLQTHFFATNETNWKRATLEGKTSARIRASWAFVEKQIARLKSDASEHNFTPMIVVVPLFEQMISDHYPHAAYQTELARIGRAHGIEVVDPLQAIRVSRPSYPRYFIPFDGHPNGLIYAIIADVVAERVQVGGFPKPSSLESK